MQSIVSKLGSTNALFIASSIEIYANIVQDTYKVIKLGVS